MGAVSAFTFHFDEVIRDSHPDIKVLAQSASCAIHAFRWGALPVWGIQAHPEIDLENTRDFLRSASAIWPEQAAVFRKALATSVDDSGSIAEILNRFLAS